MNHVIRWAYNAAMKLLTLLVIISTFAPASAQLISFGPPGPHYCEHVERIKPNLVLSRTTQVGGRIIDQTGAPFVSSIVELRLYLSELRQVSVRKVSTDKDGRFDLTMVAKGKYRLLASSTRAFQQPDWLECGDGDKCLLAITLRVNPSDMPASQCPVQ
jgi:5-hydroxyisourate hydrolase-like protein (transthyretin family)